jgi:uncharacterized protein YbbK (DUF523 family)
MHGWRCGVDGQSHEATPSAVRLLSHPSVTPIPFCPEDHALGTPRGTPDITGGDGFAVLRGDARVRDQHGVDVTTAMVAGAEAMLRRARSTNAELAMLMDMSAACGSQVISEGSRFVQPRRYQRGVGVAAAVLMRAGIPIVSQRDFATHERLLSRIDPSHRPDSDARDHHEHPWCLDHFGPNT